MAAYCTEAQVSAVIAAHGDNGDRFTTEEIATAMDYATLLVDRFCGRHFRKETTTETHRPVEGWVFLNHRPVLSISECVDAESGDDVDYDVYSEEWAKLQVYSSSLVKITYTYNSGTVPDAVQIATAEIAANYLLLPSDAFDTVRLGDMALQGIPDNRLITVSVARVLWEYSHRRRLR